MDAEVLVSLIGALGVGSAFGQWFAGSKDRRSSRAAVLVAIGNLEAARWAPFSGKQSFANAARELLTAGLLARVPRSVVAEYVELAQAAYWLSGNSWDNYPDEDEGGGAISSNFANVVRDTQALLAHIAWSPWGISRVGLKRKLSNLKQRADQIAAEDSTIREQLDRSRQYGVA